MPISLYKYLRPVCKAERSGVRAKAKNKVTAEQEFARYVASHPEEFKHLSEEAFLDLMARKFGKLSTGNHDEEELSEFALRKSYQRRASKAETLGPGHA